ncbi:WxcM-like domain-containing protein [Litoribacter alkaliphilus]|uniref:WxcM-like domain-containing protein n=1 Tax=Litoribacter ruber TaxID=702568 RepID=A0AAP2G241_9BACT|nr:FdtA/QdtA family cupin domain-containing protein [Litoribacter alkaliphilus]MBS9525589.1 WxcM-like domain-containing protein [Litoribacter alkaliphilus]
MPKTSLCKYIQLRSVKSDSGQLVVANRDEEIPFPINRVYYLIDQKGGQTRGNHANIKNQQVMIAVKGSFKVTVDDGEVKETFTVNSPSKGLLIPEKTWRTVHSLTQDAVCLVICSEKYDAEDYIKDYQEFLAIKNISKS